MFKHITGIIVLYIIFIQVSSGQVQDINPGSKAAEIKLKMKSVFYYQLQNPSRHTSRNRDYPNGWVPSSFYAGVIEAYKATDDDDYLVAVSEWAEENDYRPGPRARHADDLLCGQVYLDLNTLIPEERKILPVQAMVDALILDPKPGREDWWWCDALFMAPPAIARLGKVTGHREYHEFLHRMYWDTAEFLFDREAGLFYRDAGYFYRRTINGHKVFWSRGNGWVLAGLARTIPYLDDKDRMKEWYLELFMTMAAAVRPLQADDGYWRASLHDPEEFPAPESSGTGFMCYALAWGINNGLLDKKDYGMVVQQAWNSLVSAVHEDGRIGWVQQIGKSPGEVNFEDTQAYGAGAFLLAGSEMIKFYSKH